jgi:hypothetical protein
MNKNFCKEAYNMGFFSALSNMAGKEALSMINDFRRGKAGSASVKMAFELLASSGALYKRADADTAIAYEK